MNIVGKLILVDDLRIIKILFSLIKALCGGKAPVEGFLYMS